MRLSVRNMTTNSINFIRRGEVVTLPNVSPTRTLLQVLREDLSCSSVKEGCNEGDCGACTVVLGEAVDGKLQLRAVNSCIRFAHSVNGMAVWTAEDIVAADGHLHPAQQAMVDCHGSQCGFCTPGFVMSLFAMYQNRVCRGQKISREQAIEDLSGNLCRCTGYRPILDAAQAMESYALSVVDEANLLLKLDQIRYVSFGLEAKDTYFSPKTLAELLTLRAQQPKAQIVAGCTDVGLWVNKLHMDFDQVLDVSQVQELRRVERYAYHIAIGAAVSLEDAFAAMVQDRPQLRAFALRFAGLPVRNSGTLGGNVANGSPIGDSMPLLIALGANVVLMRMHDGQIRHREMPLEKLYTGYRKNVMAADEVLAWIKVPLPQTSEVSRIYKVSKRFEDDISAVCLCICLNIANEVVVSASIGAGGVAATPVRAVKTEAALRGKPWTTNTVKLAIDALRPEFQPISDMRASSHYRTQVLGNLLQRFWLESQGQVPVSLESFGLDDLEAVPA
jgi:xanthine dehydrogenase small subunit